MVCLNLVNYHQTQKGYKQNTKHMSEKSELKKVSMNLSNKTLTNIDVLSKLIQEPNRTRVVASALELARYILEKENSGNQFLMKDKDGKTVKLKLIV